MVKGCGEGERRGVRGVERGTEGVFVGVVGVVLGLCNYMSFLGLCVLGIYRVTWTISFRDKVIFLHVCICLVRLKC